MDSWSSNCSPHKTRGHLRRSLGTIRVDLFRLTAAHTMNLCSAQSSPGTSRVAHGEGDRGLDSDRRLDCDRRLGWVELEA